jgi:hypothetical protein
MRTSTAIASALQKNTGFVNGTLSYSIDMWVKDMSFDTCCLVADVK